MNKKEIQIIKESYRNVYKANLEYECNPASYVDMRVLIDTLGLKEHRYEVENEVISDRNNYNAIIKDMFFESHFEGGPGLSSYILTIWK